MGRLVHHGDALGMLQDGVAAPCNHGHEKNSYNEEGPRSHFAHFLSFLEPSAGIELIIIQGERFVNLIECESIVRLENLVLALRLDVLEWPVVLQAAQLEAGGGQMSLPKSSSPLYVAAASTAPARGRPLVCVTSGYARAFSILVIVLSLVGSFFFSQAGAGVDEVSAKETVQQSDEAVFPVGAKTAEQKSGLSSGTVKADLDETPVASDAAAGGDAEILITDWLVLGPCRVGLPVFSDSGQQAGRAGEVLGRRYLDLEELSPAQGDKFSWQPGVMLEWKKVALKDSVVSFAPWTADTSMVQVAYAACYLDSPRWQKVELVLRTRQRASIFLDGEELKTKEDATALTDEPEELSCELKLTRDKHLVLVKAVFDSRDSLPEWSFQPLLEIPLKRLPHTPAVSLSPLHRFSSRDIDKMKSVRDVRISPDGKWLAVLVREADAKRDKYVTFLEMFDVRSGERIHCVRMGDSISEPRWAPDSKGLVFVSDSPVEGSDLWLLDMPTRGLEKIVSEEKGLGTPRWSKDGDYVFFMSWFPQPDEKEEQPYEKLDELYERWSYWKNKSHLFVVSLSSKTRMQLTAGEFTVQSYDLSPDGSTIAFLRSVPISERPFFESELWKVDLGSLKSDTLLAERLDIYEMAWAPDGRSIAFIGECSAGSAVDVRNRYQRSLYLLDVESGTYEKLTDDTGPSVGADLLGVRWAGRLVWWEGVKRLYFVATDKTRVRLYHIDPTSPGEATEVRVPLTVPYNFDVSSDRRYLACIGTSSSDYRKVYVVDLKRKSAVEVFDPSADAMKYAIPARVEREDFVNSDGITIDGWLYYPQDFDPAGSYPLIVYYYGGVTAMGETFSGWAHWFAGQGYVYYILNPRGAVSYGRSFADAHVNDWGGLSAKDVMEGVERLLETKPFLDRGRVGCHGGSYGGFLTMSLLTQSDVFSAALAWYGISNLASYWGAGWWGYLYSDVASALSFPWNRPDVYVEKSPLFNADKIETPLLLFHGTADVNVPSVESDQMFAALRVLNKDVVYIKWEGEGHGISSKPSSTRDSRQIMLEWFDKYLKDESDAWNEHWE
jgi:dipeptidyl aminopeptidase/acylaminoacyl peptidase